MESKDQVSKDIEKGLNSPELKRNEDIPFVDDFVELNLVNPDEPIRPKRTKDEKEDGSPLAAERDRKLHASDLGEVHTSPKNDTIIVNTPEGTLYITLEPDSGRSSKPTSPITESTDLEASPTTSKSFGAAESDELIRREREAMEQRKMSLRRNSISMPTLQNLELEVLRQQYLNNPQDEVSVIITETLNNFETDVRSIRNQHACRILV